ncbi:MAG: hypothetical protein IKA41_01610 [Bacteroidaceae bacterium]|nr:hypothetical protein [Bacteroidaceae bacterium]
MKIKHWQGYDSVEAKKLKATNNKALGTKTVVIEVRGNHEWGLERYDMYDVHRWLRRFFKDCESFADIKEMRVCGKYEKTSNGDFIEVCEYIIEYTPAA